MVGAVLLECAGLSNSNALACQTEEPITVALQLEGYHYLNPPCNSDYPPTPRASIPSSSPVSQLFRSFHKSCLLGDSSTLLVLVLLSEVSGQVLAAPSWPAQPLATDRLYLWQLHGSIHPAAA